MPDTIAATHYPGADPEPNEPGIYEIFLRDVVMPFRISVYPSEHKAPQCEESRQSKVGSMGSVGAQTAG